MTILIDAKRAKGVDIKVQETFVEKRPAAREVEAVEIRPSLEAHYEQEPELEPIEPLSREVDQDGLCEPDFLQKLQDLEVVEGSAARFDVRVRGMYPCVPMCQINVCMPCPSVR